MWKFIKMLTGLCLFPLGWSVSLAVYHLYSDSVGSAAASGWEALALPIGFVLWVVVFFILPHPMRTYVLGHELTHALWSLMMGGRVGKLKVGKTGGHVELSRTNFVVTLAPYFFPFYTFLVIAAYYIAGLVAGVEPYRAWWMGAVGFTWAFHITFTVHMLTERQPDIHEHGRIFSYTIIYTMNVLVIGVWMVLVGSPDLATFGELIALETAHAYTYAFEHIMAAWAYAMDFINRRA